MSPDALRAFFRLGIWVVLVSLILVLAVSRNSPEFVVSVCSLGVGLALIAGVFIVRRLLNS